MATAMAINLETLESQATTEIGSVWQAGKKNGLELGEVCYKWRTTLEPSKGGWGSKGKGLAGILTVLDIPRHVAEYWIYRYEVSIGVRTAKEKKVEQPVESVKPATPLTYEDNFLTPEEADEFEIACQSLTFTRRRNKRNPKYLIRNMNVLWSDVPDTHAEGSGIPRQPISTAPVIIQKIVQRLSTRLGRTVNYVSLMGYEDGKDHINWHQHHEDYGHDTPVAIVSTGVERNFSYRLKGKGQRTDILARRGSLIILPTEFNTTHEHAILDDISVQGIRYAANCKCMDDIYYRTPIDIEPSSEVAPAFEVESPENFDDLPEPQQMCPVCVEHPHRMDELPDDYSKHPELQAKAVSRSHGMGLDRLRKLASKLGLRCAIKYDDSFKITYTHSFTSEANAREWLKSVKP